jgi:hypothetical protein
MVNGRMSACLREANVKARRATMMLAAAGLAISPVASSAATSLSIARAAPQMTGSSYLEGEGHGGHTAAIALGGLLLVLIAIVAIAGDSANHAENPHSP